MKRPRILVVEDDRPSMVLIATLLRGRGYLVDEADSGGEALRRIKEHCPNVVISDLVMPGMNGLDLLRAIHNRGVKAECEIFFLLITGHADSSAVEAIVEGAADCLLKPVDPDELIALLERHNFKVET